jgi:aspartate 1-decarboxylase
MKRIMLKAKIHHARVTETNLNYEGSPYEKAHVYNVSNGERFSTYLIKGEKGSGKVGVFGAAARRARVGDTLIIVSYVFLEEEETEFFMPKILILGADNKIAQIK